jgi:valyl-tRNA synthetase
MLGDTAVAVHPKDERYLHLHGKRVRLPLVGRLIPIVADEYSDPTKGTGAVKITPAHDFNDFEVGRRHGLPLINVLDAEAEIKIADNADFLRGFIDNRFGHVVSNMRGHDRIALRDQAAMMLREAGHPELASTVRELDCLDRLDARQRVVEMMESRGLLDKIEPHVHIVPHGDRSGAVIEPWLTIQWYVDAEALAQPALEAVRSGKSNFIPKNWEKTYFDWLKNIQPWCISRQLWWGHQIPAWYGPDHKIFVELSEEDAKAAAEAHYGCQVVAEYPASMTVTERVNSKLAQLLALKDRDGAATQITIARDEDVLDTWFSSALWPFSTLGWPDETPELKSRYPTSVLVTGFDIIFFWVARMMMMSLHFMHEVPFRDVYIHALVRDEKGAKMSKSKGNVVDPLQLIETYGADALRFTLAAMAAQGRDIKLSTQRIEGYRNFGTKLWNAGRFAEMNGCTGLDPVLPPRIKVKLNLWILDKTVEVFREVTKAIESYRFNDAANAAYRFVWNIFCDWYLQLNKTHMKREKEVHKDNALCK